MSLPQYNPCKSFIQGNCSDVKAGRCDLCVVDTENRDEQLILNTCLESGQGVQVDPNKLVDWALEAPEPGKNIDPGCYNIANKIVDPSKIPTQNTKCANGGIYDIYTQTCICTPGYVGLQCEDKSETCVGTSCITSKNSRQLDCDSLTCQESLVSVPPSKPFTIKDFLILLAILFIITLPILWIGLIKGFGKSKTSPSKITNLKK